MNDSRKIDLLYRMAKGQSLSNVTRKEQNELRRYKIYSDEEDFYTTKSNIRSYVEAVDSGKTHLSFYDWCINHGKADRRRKGSSKSEVVSNDNLWGILAAIFFGGWMWGSVFCHLQGQREGDAVCFILGFITTFILNKINRRWLIFNVLILPVIIMAIICKL